MKNPKHQLDKLEFDGFDSKNLFKVKRIDFFTDLPTFATTILPLMEPGTLEQISIDCDGNPDYADQLFGMEQWKRAKSIKIN